MSELSCRIDILLGAYFALSSFLWTVCISFYIFQTVVQTLDPLKRPWLHREKAFTLLCFGIPVVITSIILVWVRDSSIEELQDQNFGCFVPNNNSVRLWYRNYFIFCELTGRKKQVGLALYYIPVIFSWVATSCFYVAAQCKIHKTGTTPEDAEVI